MIVLQQDSLMLDAERKRLRPKVCQTQKRRTLMLYDQWTRIKPK